MTKALRLAALLTAAALTLTACGTSEGSGSGQDHNAADVTFASDMIQHHAGALQMVDMTMGRDLDPEVATLADDIRAAQAPEIEQMTEWLEKWGEEVPATVRDHANAHGGMGNGGMDMGSDMPGMASAAELKALDKADGAQFQDMWLKMMIAHHEGAIQMAETELADGQYQPALALAKRIKSSQQAEIDQMKQMLGS